MKRPVRLTLFVLLVLALVAAGLAAVVAFLNLRGEQAMEADPHLASGSASVPVDDAQRVDRGRYLALVGNCAGCHTAVGGAAYAGGRTLPTPFGAVYTSNLTPDPATGIGAWTSADFWRAMHHGRSKDGRLLNPVFPYDSYTHVTRADSDAIHAYLRTLPAVAQPNRESGLRFPYNTQAALAVWRALYFRADERADQAQADATRGELWSRGAYLARGLGHCISCHSARNALGAITGPLELSGGAIPSQGWYAPSLASADEAGVAHWNRQDVVDLLKTGRVNGASVIGPMAEVVYGSTQHWADGDLQAVAVFLQELPQAPERKPADVRAASDATLARGAKIFEQQCAACHGPAGQGAAGAYPALAGNRAVTMDAATNLVRIVREGGFAPATAGNPRPYGMPPFSHLLDDADTAAVLTYIRQSWGNKAPEVTAVQVLQAGRKD